MEKVRYRNEIKYLINYHSYVTLKSRFSHILKPDSHSDSYRVRSLYFDDPHDTSLYEKLDGVDEREKYRIRIYDFSDRTIKLERKTRSGQFIYKESAPLDREMFDKIINLEYDSGLLKSGSLLGSLCLKSMKDALRPVVIVDYLREAYTFPHDNIRITFDSDLRYPLNSLELFAENIPSRAVLPPSALILEVKYDRFLPDFIRNLLQTESSTKMSLSKYAMCRESNIYQEVLKWME